MNTKLILAFILGLLSGGGGTAFLMKKRFDKELDGIYNSVEAIQKQLEFSDEDMHEIKKPVDFLRKMKFEPPEEEYEDDPDDMEDEDEDDDDSDLDVDDPEKLYPDPELPLEKVDVENTIVDENREWSMKVKPSKPKPIHNISGDEYFNNDDLYAKIGIQYYPGTGMYLDLDGDEVKDHEGLIGKGLLFFGLNSGDKDVVYIRNTIKRIDVEVVRMEE